MLPSVSRGLTFETGMEPKPLRQKLDGILEAIASGRTCEQILTEDQTLCYHDIFHAVAEAPTSYWHRIGASKNGKRPPRKNAWGRTPANQRAD